PRRDGTGSRWEPGCGRRRPRRRARCRAGRRLRGAASSDRRGLGGLQQALPDRHLERTAGDVELELERSPFAVEVLLELLGGRLEQRRLVILRAELQVAAGKGDSRQSEVARDQRERADRALV